MSEVMSKCPVCGFTDCSANEHVHPSPDPALASAIAFETCIEAAIKFGDPQMVKVLRGLYHPYDEMQLTAEIDKRVKRAIDRCVNRRDA